MSTCRACVRRPTAPSSSTARFRSATSTARSTGSLPDEEATTIAGLVIHEAKTIPAEKQAFTFHGKRFVVMKREKEPHHQAAHPAGLE
jgi:CBS domain containing-hemolysin-like protein